MSTQVQEKLQSTVGGAKSKAEENGAIHLVNQIRQLENEMSRLRDELQTSRIGSQRLAGDIATMRSDHSRAKAELESRESAVRGELNAKTKELTHLRSSIKSDAEIIKTHEDRQLARARVFDSSASRWTVNVGFGPKYFYGSQHHKDIRVLERIALKNHSASARDAIALSATNLLLDAESLLRITRAYDAGILRDNALPPFREWLPRSVMSLARVLADQQLLDSDLDDARALYRFAQALWGVGKFAERDRLIYTETLATVRRFEELNLFAEAADLKSSHPQQWAFYESNRLRDSGETGTAWLRPVNDLLVDAGFAPINVSAEGPDPLASLAVDAPAVENGPLVSIIMPTHNGSAYILTAIESVLNQSWKNVELLIVDDYSDEHHWEILQEILPKDSRVALVRLDANQGAYRARRRAFEMARGDFVAIHDDDDWSHPQKIETQVRHLLRSPDVIANMSNMVRIDEEMKFLRINDNPEFSQKNYSSMMIRKDDVTRLGGWDDLNRAADAEFHDRIYAVTGKRAQQIDTPPLSFMRARRGSLTAGEINRGALDFGRQTYGLLYGSWHAELKSGSAQDLSVSDFQPALRPFSVPQNLLSGNRNVAAQKLDILYCTDFRFPGGNSALAEAEIREAVNSGFRVGILQLDSPVLRAPRPMNPGVANLLLEMKVPVFALEDKVQAKALIVRNPTVLQFADNLRTRVQPDRVRLIANTAPASIGGAAACYSIVDCIRHAENTWGVNVSTLAESPQTRRLITALEPAAAIDHDIWPGFVPDVAIREPKERRRDARPVVGRHSRDHKLKWPDAADAIRSAYVSPGTFDTKILGGAASIAGLVDLAAEGCQVLPFGAMSPADYLDGVDFWVYMHSTDLIESFGMAVAEAMAAGCVTILPPYMEDMFGDGALYAKPEQVSSLISEVWSDADRFAAQSARGVETIRRSFSSAAVRARLDWAAGGKTESSQ